MANSQTLEPTQQKPLRLWPGIVAVVLQWLAFYVVPIVLPGPSAGYIAPLGAVLGGLAVIVWWAFFSRAPRSDRWGAIVLMIVAMLATSRVIHESIGEGMFGMMFVRSSLFAEEVRPGTVTKLKISVKQVESHHELTVGRLESWIQGGARSPRERVLKDRLRMVLAL